MTRKYANMTTRRKLWTGLGVLVLVSPLGLILPALFGAGGAWGEWGLEEVRKIAGFIPDGMKKLAERWSSPMPDYALPGQRPGLVGESMGYLAAAVIGVGLAAAAGWLVARLLARREKRCGDHNGDPPPGRAGDR